MRTNTNGKQAITGRTAARKASAEGTGQGQEQGQSDGGHLGASGALSGPRKGESAAKSLGKITRHRTDSQIRQLCDLTSTELAAALEIIETEIRTVKRQSQADFLHSERKIRAAVLALNFLTVDQRARLAACPLPSKGERLSELTELQQFLASQ